VFGRQKILSPVAGLQTEAWCDNLDRWDLKAGAASVFDTLSELVQR
jgi:hypothetical protein